VTGGLVTLGETMGLLTPVEIGPAHHGAQVRLGLAGAESNVAIGVRRLGADATWIGRVGRDEMGAMVTRELRAEGVTVHATEDDAPTGLMFKIRRTGELTRVTYYRAGSAGSRLAPPDVDETTVASAGVLHVTGITPALGAAPAAAVRAAVEIARAAGVPVSLDLNYRSALWDATAAGPALRELVKQADVVFAGAHEATLVVEADSPEATARALAELGPRQVVVKLGARGCVAVVDGVAYRRAAVPVRVVDPVGAGDAFVAGYLSELMDGAPPERRLTTATAAGAFVVTVPGDWEGLPHRHELALLDATDEVVR
jgi:2-dehydro-3-deoxygluconokinase